MTLTASEQRHYSVEKATAALVQYCYRRKCSGTRLSADKAHALCMLTWLPSLRSTKLPALWRLWNRRDVYDAITAIPMLRKIGFEERIVRLASRTTGFVNYYHAYRNSSLGWLRKNLAPVSRILAMAASLSTDEQAHRLADLIESLPRVPKPTTSVGSSMPGSLLTPLVACLDPRRRFPIVNKASHVIGLQSKLGILESSLSQKCDAITDLIGREGMRDAFMIDAASTRLAKHKHLQNPGVFNARLRSPNRPISKKDESGYKIRGREESEKGARLHNAMTNRMTAICRRLTYVVLEGKDPFNYDMLIEDPSGDRQSVLVETKSSSDRADIRLAIGQLLDYRRAFSRQRPELVILLPAKPQPDDIDLLSSVDIGVLWFQDRAHKSVSGTIRL